MPGFGLLSRWNALWLATGLALFSAGVLPAQDPANPPNANATPAAPAAAPQGGFQVRTVAAYVAYYSSGVSNTGLQTGAPNLSYDVGAGGSATFEWTKFVERTSFSAVYTPSYAGQFRYSSLNSLNHTFSVSAIRKLTPRWTLNVSASGNLSSMAQSLFNPTALSNVASTPATFDSLSAGLLSSKFDNAPQLATVLTSAPLVDSPVRNLLYGERLFSSAVRASVSYSHSPRLNLTFSGGSDRTQHVSDGQASAASNSSLLGDTTSVSASAALSYSLTPLTQVGGSLVTTRISSFVQDAYTTNILASIGRTFARRWIVQVHGGVGVTNPVRQTLVSPTATALPITPLSNLTPGPQPTGGGSLAYKSFSHTILGSYERTVSDAYGLGASATSSLGAGWHWKQPGRTWGLDGAVSWQQLAINPLTHLTGWNASAGFSRTAGPHLTILMQYVYLYYGSYQANAPGTSQNAVRITVAWNPRALPMR